MDLRTSTMHFVICLLVLLSVPIIAQEYSEEAETKIAIFPEPAMGDYPEVVDISFTVFGTSIRATLWKNLAMFAKNYTRTGESGDVGEPFSNSDSVCQYSGKMGGAKQSRVTISLCDGIQGVLMREDEVYVIRPVEDSDEHLVEKFLGGANFHKMAGTMRYIETVLLLEPSVKTQFDGDVFAASELIVSVANVLLNSVNLQIVLKETTVERKRGLVHDDVSRLVNLRKLKQQLGDVHDYTLKFYVDMFAMESKTLLHGMCSSEYSVSMVPVLNSFEKTSTSLAHAIGHSMGLSHDMEPEQYVMSALFNQFNINWSDVSVSGVKRFYDQKQGNCLLNEPVTLVTDKTFAVCGNGIVEDYEDCDCGLNCQNEKCCNSDTCLFVAGAVCSKGECCDLDTCQIKEASTTCRASAQACDLPEYCDGTSSECPQNTHLKDGYKCRSSYCYEGECKTHDTQCKMLWGDTAKMADKNCFDNNVNGDSSGFCKFNHLQQRYTPCDPSSVMCGALFCTTASEKILIAQKMARVFNSYTQDDNGKVDMCTSTLIDLGVDVKSPGIAMNGLKCGDGKMCLNSECVHLDTSTIKETECSNYGKINNLGQCHCDDGYGSADCSEPGLGGSLSSGPATQIFEQSTTEEQTTIKETVTTTTKTEATTIPTTTKQTKATIPTTTKQTEATIISTTTKKTEATIPTTTKQTEATISTTKKQTEAAIPTTTKQTESTKIPTTTVKQTEPTTLAQKTDVTVKQSSTESTTLTAEESKKIVEDVDNLKEETFSELDKIFDNFLD